MTHGPGTGKPDGSASAVKRILRFTAGSPDSDFGYTWPLAGAAVPVVISLAVPVSLPGVRNLRLRRAAPAPRRADVSAEPAGEAVRRFDNLSGREPAAFIAFYLLNGYQPPIQPIR
jgi:hypothetical protein